MAISNEVNSQLLLVISPQNNKNALFPIRLINQFWHTLLKGLDILPKLRAITFILLPGATEL